MNPETTLWDAFVKTSETPDLWSSVDANTDGTRHICVFAVGAAADILAELIEEYGDRLPRASNDATREGPTKGQDVEP